MGGALGATGEVERCRGVFGFEEKLFYRAEELVDFFGKAGWEEETKDAGVVVSKIDLGAVGKFDVEEVAEVGAQILEGRVTSQEDTPAFGPGLFDERVEQSGFLRDADEVRREVRELRTLRSFVERLIFLLGFVDYFEDARLARGIEERIERLEIFAEQILQSRWCRRGGCRLGSRGSYGERRGMKGRCWKRREFARLQGSGGGRGRHRASGGP